MGVTLNPATLLNGGGMDVSSVVSQIEAQQQGQVTIWQNEQTDLSTDDGVLLGLNQNLNTLQTDIQALANPDGPLAALAANSSDSNILTADAQVGAAPGTYQIVVNNLASAGQIYTAELPSATASFLPSGATGGDIKLQVGGSNGTVYDIPITQGSNDTLNTLASYINQQSSQNNWGVSASVVSDANGSRLAIYSQATGTAGALAITANTTTGTLDTADLASADTSILPSGQSSGDIQLQIGSLTQVGTTHTASGAAVLSGGATGSTWASTIGGLTGSTDLTNGGANSGDVITVNLTNPGTGAQSSYSFTIGQSYGGVALTNLTNFDTILANTGQFATNISGGNLTITANAAQVSLTDASGTLENTTNPGTSSAATTASTFTIGNTNPYTYSTYGVGSSATVGNLINAINADGEYSASLNGSGDLVIGYGSVGGMGTAPALAETGTGTWAVGPTASFVLGGTTVDLPITAGSNDTLNTLASYINQQSSQNNWGVTANVVQDSGGYHLAIYSQAQGPAGALAFTNNTTILTTVANPATNLAFQTPTGGTDADITIDGMDYQSQDNTISNAIPGVTLNLASADPNTTVQLTVGPDANQATQAINSFVTDYNAIISNINQQYTIDPTTNAEGPLASDSSLRSLQSSLLNDASYAVTGNSGGLVNLASLGINMNNDGTLTVGTAPNGQSLSQIIASNPAAVQSFFQNASTGFATNFNSDMTNLTDPTTGVLNADIAENQTEQQDLTNQITNFQNQLLAQQQELTTELDQVNATLEEYPFLVAEINAELGNTTSSTSNSSSTSGTSSTSSTD